MQKENLYIFQQPIIVTVEDPEQLNGSGRPEMIG